jgi:hypothetical protein
MATQQIEFEAPSGLTLTCTLHVAGSDTVSHTASAVTEQTNRKGIYRATFSSVSANTYQLIARSGSTGVASWWGFAQDAGATFSFGTSVTRADYYVNLFISEQIALDIENGTNNWDIASSALGNQSATNVWNSLTSSYTTANGSFGQRVLRSTTSNSTVAVTGSNHVAADIHQIQAGVIVDADFAAGSIYEKLGTLIEADPVSGFRYTTQALEQAPSGGGGGGQTVVISPSAALQNQYSKTTDRNPNPLDCPRLAQKTFSISIFQLSSEGLKVPVTMTGRTLRVVFELPTGTDLVVIEDSGITKVGNTITFTNPVSASTPATGQRQMTGSWSCREVSTDFPWAWGSWQVFDVAIKD